MAAREVRTLFTYDYLERNGRLGNQLFQIAATIGKTAAYPTPSMAYFKPDWEYRPYFSVPDPFFTKSYGTNPPDEVLDGGTEYFQELHYFDQIEKRIREYFEPSDLSLEYLRSAPEYEKVCYGMADKASCSIHVRRGDYTLYPDHFPLPTAEYYQRAVEKVLEEQPKTEFYVFSDDIQWCKAHFGTQRMHFVTGTPRPVEIVDRKRQGQPLDQFDLFAMSLCDRHIMANSTFSWWGSWLSGDERVIYPSVWFGNHPAVRSIPWRKMIPETWIEVPV